MKVIFILKSNPCVQYTLTTISSDFFCSGVLYTEGLVCHMHGQVCIYGIVLFRIHLTTVKQTWIME